MKKISLLLSTLLLIILLGLTCYDGYYILLSAFSQIKNYMWLGIGAVCFYFLDSKIKSLDFLKVLAHEWSHTLVSFMFFRRVHSLQANEQSGVMYHSGGRFGDVFISLAPYCFPYMVYFFLIIRCFVQFSSLWIFDIIIGALWAFHLSCFKSQTGSHQTDINQYPIWFAYLFIWTFRLFNYLTFILCFIVKGGRYMNLDGSLTYLAHNFYNSLLRLIG